MSPYRFVDGGAVADRVPGYLILSGAVVEVPEAGPPPAAKPEAPPPAPSESEVEVEFTPSASLEVEPEPKPAKPKRTASPAAQKRSSVKKGK